MTHTLFKTTTNMYVRTNWYHLWYVVFEIMLYLYTCTKWYKCHDTYVHVYHAMVQIMVYYGTRHVCNGAN